MASCRRRWYSACVRYPESTKRMSSRSACFLYPSSIIVPTSLSCATESVRPNAALSPRVFASVPRRLRAGSGRILSIHIPGEIPDLQSLHLHVMDHDLITLTECTLGFISHSSLREITRRRPNIAEILWRDSLVDAALFHEWIVNVGQRPALNRRSSSFASVSRSLDGSRTTGSTCP